MAQILDHQLNALRIYQKIQKIKRDYFEALKEQGLFKNLEKKYEHVFTENKIDLETARVLKNIFNKAPKTNYDSSPKHDPLVIALDQIIKILKMSSNTEKNISVKLTADGELFCSLNKDKRYNMKKNGKSFKILQLLNHKYISTEKIKESIHSKNTAAVRKAIGVINAKIKNILKLEQFVESKAGDGYRINNKYIFIKL